MMVSVGSVWSSFHIFKIWGFHKFWVIHTLISLFRFWKKSVLHIGDGFPKEPHESLLVGLVKDSEFSYLIIFIVRGAVIHIFSQFQVFDSVIELSFFCSICHLGRIHFLRTNLGRKVIIVIFFKCLVGILWFL